MAENYLLDADFAERAARAIRWVEAFVQAGGANAARGLGPLADLGLIPFVPDATVPAYGLMIDDGIDGGGFVPTLKTKAMTGIGQRPIFVNCSTSVAANAPGFCRLTAPSWHPFQIAYDDGDGTPAAGEVWGPAPSSFKARKGRPGFRVLMAGSGGLVWVIFDPEEILEGKLDGDLTPTGSATLSVYQPSDWTDTGWDVTIYPGYVQKKMAYTIPQDKAVTVRWSVQAQKWMTLTWEC